LNNSIFIAKPIASNLIKTYQFSAQAPSNIALVKYWGKKEHQIPANPSLSFTLKNCHTDTKIIFTAKTARIAQFEIYFEGEKKASFKPKLATFFERINQYVSFLSEFDMEIHTSNSFPHSSGIASSASGMAAIAHCIMQLEKSIDATIDEASFYKKTSFLARLGSGSASRSVKGEVVVWGTHKSIPASTDLYGVAFPFEVHQNFKNYQDTILLVDKGEKVVSSTLGHNLMNKHPYAKTRFKQAHENLSQLTTILQNGDLDAFIELVESEALTLHAMMMTSLPYFILMKANTLEIINAIWKFRKETRLHLCFTLDAGANVHLLYPDNEKEKINNFITSTLAGYCQNNQYICDELGNGTVAK
jgi:diphosphomevalonate decarboxylase